MQTGSETPQAPGKPARTVLCVDDAEFVHQIYRVAFRRLRDWEATHVYDGSQAMTAIARARPHLVILDINMPVMDGLRFLDTLKAQWAGPLPHVLVASTEDDQIRDAMRRGANSYLRKPFTLDEFLRAIDHISPTLPPPAARAATPKPETSP